MATIRVDPSAPDSPALARAAAILRRGGLVAFPTETVYGLGANALDATAVAGIFAAKGRPGFNPLIVHVSDAAAAREYVTSWPEVAAALAAAFWPGPLTLVLPRREVIPGIVTAGLPSVALRVPAHPVARALLDVAGIPIAAPSANRYTELSPTTAAHVERALGDRVELVLDGGPTHVGIESTVVDLSGPTPLLLRPGRLSLAELREVAGTIDLPAEDAPAADSTAPRRSPGMVGRHYAPRARLSLFGGDGDDDRGVAAAMAERATAAGQSVGALLLAPLDAPIAHALRMPAEPAAYAHALYAALHRLDDSGCALVLVERVPSDDAWAGVRDRLERAATA